jgi:ABC-type transport system substrate-binding protein
MKHHVVEKGERKMKRKAIISFAAITVLLVATLVQLQGTSQIELKFGAPATAQPLAGQRGPRIDNLRYKVARSPFAKLIEMTLGPPTGSDLWTGMISPTYIADLNAQGKTISSREGFHLSYFGINYRVYPLSDVNFRHALAHLIPKDRLIDDLFYYVVVKADALVPPAQSLWYNNYVDSHPYSPSEAEAILAAAGYQKVGGVWKDKDGGDLPTLTVYTPHEVEMPTSFTVGIEFVEEAIAIGLINLVYQPMYFATYHSLVYDEWNFDIYWEERVVGRFPDFLYDLAHSNENYLGSKNPTGINWSELDAELETLKFSLDFRPPAQVAAANKSQELLAGGLSTNPLSKPAPPSMLQALPYLPVYSQNFYDAAQPQLRYLVNMFGYGTDNDWTRMNVYWNTPNEYRPGTSEKTIVWIEQECPERLNPLWAATVYAWDYMESLYDGLMATSPYTLLDEPWLASDWSYEAVPGGMDVTFNLTLTDPEGQSIKWQDGKPISINDVKFSWDFLKNWQIPRYWSSFRFYDPANTVIVDSDTIRARTTTTSQQLIYDLARTAYMFPPQVWTQNPVTGTPWSSTTEILQFDLSAYSYPLPGNTDPGPNALPTQLFGTGPFILQHSASFIQTNHYGDLNANRNYWLKTTQIQAKIVDMFHRAGDVNYDGQIDKVSDARDAMRAYGTSPGDPLWNPNADLNGDSVVDIFDTIPVRMYYGETRTLPSGESSSLSHESAAEKFSKLVEGLMSTASSRGTTAIYVEPGQIINESLRTGDYFYVDVDIADVIDLMGYDFRLTFNSSILNAISVTTGKFLPSPGVWKYVKNNVAGFVWFASSRGCSRYGVTGSGRLARIQFQVAGYGKCALKMKGFTKLGDSHAIRVNHVALDGYFDNRIPGDVNIDRVVNIRDLALLGKAYGSILGSPNWNEDADFDRNNVIDIIDLALLSQNYGKTI